MKQLTLITICLILVFSFFNAESGAVVCPDSGKKCVYTKTVDGVKYTVESEYKGLFKVVIR